MDWLGDTADIGKFVQFLAPLVLPALAKYKRWVSWPSAVVGALALSLGAFLPAQLRVHAWWPLLVLMVTAFAWIEHKRRTLESKLEQANESEPKDRATELANNANRSLHGFHEIFYESLKLIRVIQQPEKDRFSSNEWRISKLTMVNFALNFGAPHQANRLVTNAYKQDYGRDFSHDVEALHQRLRSLINLRDGIDDQCELQVFTTSNYTEFLRRLAKNVPYNDFFGSDQDLSEFGKHLLNGHESFVDSLTKGMGTPCDDLSSWERYAQSLRERARALVKRAELPFQLVKVEYAAKGKPDEAEAVVFLQGTQLWNKPESINGFYSRDPNLLRVLDAVVELLWSDEYVADTIVCGLEHKWLRPKRVTDALGEGMMRLRAEQGVYDELMGMVRNSLEPGAGGTKPT